MKRFNKIQIFDRKNKFPVPNRNGFTSFPLFLSLIHMQGIELSTSLIKRFISLIYNDLYTTYRFCFPPSGRFRGPEPLPVPRRSISFTSDQKMRNRSPAHAESQKIVNFERIFPETTLRKPPARSRNGHEDNRIVGIIRHRAAKKKGAEAGRVTFPYGRRKGLTESASPFNHTPAGDAPSTRPTRRR